MAGRQQRARRGSPQYLGSPPDPSLSRAKDAASLALPALGEESGELIFLLRWR